MARYIDARCRLCRAKGEKLFLKGAKCTTEKCPAVKRAFPPGQHGKRRKKESNYGLQLGEKQKAKRIYGILERQFKKYFRTATRFKGVTGHMLLEMLERRLDNVVFRLGFAQSRSQSRQLVRHDHAYVNGRKVNIPSYSVKKDDVIEVRGKESLVKAISERRKEAKDRVLPSWLECDKDALKGKVLRNPEKGDIDFSIQEQLIVELYSK